MTLAPTRPFSLIQGLMRLVSLLVMGLFCQCSTPEEKARKELLKKGIGIDAASLVLYAQSADLPVLKLMQQAGADFSQRDALGLTPLLAASQLNTASLPFLLEATPAAAIDAADGAGRTALSYAWQQKRQDAYQQLLARGAKPDQTQHPSKALLADVLASSTAEQSTLVDSSIAACSDASPVFAEAMLVAGGRHHLPWMRSLLEKQASGNVLLPKGSGQISLFLDCLQRGVELPFLEKLIAHGAVLPTPKTVDAMNPLDVALTKRDLPLAKRLLEWGADPQAATPESLSPMDAAIQEKLLDFTDLFLAKGQSAVPHLPKALAQGNESLLALFQKHGWDVNAVFEPLPSRKLPPIHYAVEIRNATSIRWLLQHGADPLTIGTYGQDSFAAAVLHGDAALVQPFLEKGYDVNRPFRDFSPETAEFAKAGGSAYFEEWFQKDKSLTPLMLAAALGHEDVVDALLRAGAKRGAKTHGWKRFAVNFACESQQIRCAQLLLGRPKDDKRDVKIIVSLSQQKATIYKNGSVVRSTRISSGRSDFPTPRGRFVISDRQADWTSSIYKVPMPFFMRLSCRDFGLHEGIVSSRNASHGCIRLPKAEAPVFFELMKIGDPVTVQ